MNWEFPVWSGLLAPAATLFYDKGCQHGLQYRNIRWPIVWWNKSWALYHYKNEKNELHVCCCSFAVICGSCAVLQNNVHKNFSDTFPNSKRLTSFISTLLFQNSKSDLCKQIYTNTWYIYIYIDLFMRCEYISIYMRVVLNSFMWKTSSSPKNYFRQTLANPKFIFSGTCWPRLVRKHWCVISSNLFQAPTPVTFHSVAAALKHYVLL